MPSVRHPCGNPSSTQPSARCTACRELLLAYQTWLSPSQEYPTYDPTSRESAQQYVQTYKAEVQAAQHTLTTLAHQNLQPPGWRAENFRFHDRPPTDHPYPTTLEIQCNVQNVAAAPTPVNQTRLRPAQPTQRVPIPAAGPVHPRDQMVAPREDAHPIGPAFIRQRANVELNDLRRQHMQRPRSNSSLNATWGSHDEDDDNT